jgi:hypothetical protein
LAEPYGVTGELLYANEFVTVIRTSPLEIVVVADRFSLRTAWTVIGVTDAKITFHNGQTGIQLFCNSIELAGTMVRGYNNTSINPASLSVRYEEMLVSELEECQNP